MKLGLPNNPTRLTFKVCSFNSGVGLWPDIGTGYFLDGTVIYPTHRMRVDPHRRTTGAGAGPGSTLEAILEAVSGPNVREPRARVTPAAATIYCRRKLPGGEVVRPPREGGMIGCPSAEVDSEPRTRLAAAAARHVNLPNEKVT